MSTTAGKVISCKAAVAWEAGKPLVIEDVEVVPPQEKEGLPSMFPLIFGHEAAGIMESVGEGVSDLKPGDHLLPVFTGECGECPHWKFEESSMFDLLRINPAREVMINDGKSRLSINGKPVSRFLGTSTFSQYNVVHSGCLAKIIPQAPLDIDCVLSCGITAGATLNVGKPNKGSSVAIFGLGEVGLAAARIARASRIIGIHLNPSRYEQEIFFGVYEFVNPKEYNQPIQEGRGVTVFVGVPSMDAVFKTNPFLFLNERTIKGAARIGVGEVSADLIFKKCL